MDIFLKYPYLFSSLIGVIAVTIAGKLLLPPTQQRLTIFSGLINVPAFPFLLLIEGTYWSPIRPGGWDLGGGDILSAYGVAAIAWFSVMLGLRKTHITYTHNLMYFLKRYCVVSFISGMIFFYGYINGIDAIVSLLMTYLILGILLFVRFSTLRKLALSGAWRFPVIYLMLVKIYFFLWPEFIKQWDTTVLLGQLIKGIPLGEIIWAVLFGLYWPLVFGYALDVQIDQQ